MKHNVEKEQRRCTLIKRIIEDDEGWIAYLNHQIDKELDKDPGEQDWDLIEEYQKALDEVCKGRFDPDPDIKKEKLEELRNLYRKAGKKKSVSQNRPWWVPWAAACILLVILGIPVTSAAINHISPVDVIRQWGKQLFNIPYDVPVEESGITFVRHEDVKNYASLEELLEREDLHILYPTWLPRSVDIEKIYYYERDGQYNLTFDFDDDFISYSIHSINDDAMYSGDTSKSFDVDGLKIEAIILERNGKFYINFEYDGLSYNIGASDNEQAEGIMKGLHMR